MTTALDTLHLFNATHPVQTNVLRDLSRSIEWSRTDRKISIAMGPSGSGKSRLATLATASLDRGPGRATIYLQASSEVGARAFSMRQFLLTLLEKLDDPAPSRHYASPAQLAVLPLRATTGAALLVAARNRLRRLQPAALFIDEANYMASGTPRQIESNSRNLTWLADTGGVPIVVLGTYTVLALPKVGPDTNRRMRVLHHPRYGYTAEGIREFGKVVALFVAELVRLEIADLDLQITDRAGLHKLFAGTEGCVGVLHDWVWLAAQRATTLRRALRIDDFDQTLGALMADPESFRSQLIAGERLAAGARHRNRYAPVERPVAEKPVIGPDRSRRATRTPVGERVLGRDAAFGAVLP